jgi:hypothetical protein
MHLKDDFIQAAENKETVTWVILFKNCVAQLK